MTPKTLLLDVVNVITEAISDLPHEQTEEWSAFFSSIREWLSSESRVITDASFASAEKFIQAELDYLTPGDRGMGRSSNFWPRFAAKHRNAFQKLDEAALSAIRCEFMSMIFAGYLFVEYLMEYVAAKPIARHPESAKNSERLFTQWIPMIYSPLGPGAIDKAMKEGMGEAAYDNSKSFWWGALFDPLVQCLGRLDIAVDDNDKLILFEYFNSGMVLRHLEYRPPLTEEEVLDIVTAGGYSATKSGVQPSANRSGCAVLLLAAL